MSCWSRESLAVFLNLDYPSGQSSRGGEASLPLRQPTGQDRVNRMTMADTMRLSSGTRLGPYAIESLLGAGGMGEVYRARDTRLDRAVALKVLPEALAADAAHHARFQREARIISSLNHPHVCALHDIGQHESQHYLVLELLEGETLAARLARGALSQSQAVRVGAQIADALAAAHRHGLVHRDLKPANVMLTPSGVKLLDFGLAKPVATGGVVTPLAATATFDGGTPATAEGQIFGTLQYMAPEQVQGLPTDARTDIFALGAVLYEMLTGRKAFEAPTPAGLIASILRSDPPAVSATVPGTPGALDAVIERCLAKEPGDRWQSAHDVKLQLEWLQSHASGAVASPVPTAVPRRRWRLPLATAIAGALVAATPVALWRSPAGPADLVPRRLEMTLPQGTVLRDALPPDVPEISPDGRWVAYAATVVGRRQLHLRSLASTESRVLVDDAVSFPFWAPDSRALGFFSQGSLKTISIGGGAARVVAPATQGLGGSWAGGRILFASAPSGDFRQDHGLYTIPETGGTPARVEMVPPPEGSAYTLPRLLPDGRSFLTSTFPQRSLHLASLDSPQSRLVTEVDGPAAWGARFLAGYLLWARGEQLVARGFDPRSGQFTAPEVPIAQGVGTYSVASDGTIVFPTRSAAAFTQPTWFDRRGVPGGTLADPAAYEGLSLAPDGRHAAVWKTSGDGNVDVWEVDLSTGVLSRMTSDPAADSDATWAPDGTRVAFTSTRSGRGAVYVKDVASGREELVASIADAGLVVDGWTPDGRALVARQPVAESKVYLVALDGDRTPRPLVAHAFTVDETQVSPDGRWVAYNANESGTWEVYVARFPAFTSRRRVSTAGGVQPMWRRDGKELFYLAPDAAMMSVAIDAGAELTVQRPVKLFDTGISPNANMSQYGVTPDGQRFLGLNRDVPERETLTVLLNWLTPENLGRR